MEWVLSVEKYPEGFINLGGGEQFDAGSEPFEAFHVRNDHPVESETFGFLNALLYSVHGTDLAGQTDLSGHADCAFDVQIEAGREDGGDDGEVDSGVVDLQASGDVQEDVFLCQFKAGSFLEDGQEHV